MAIIITWSKTALQDLQKLMDYLHENWGDAAAKEFAILLENKLAILKKMPESGQKVWFRTDIRKCVLTKHNTLYYKLQEGKIEIEKIRIVTIFDNRQNPKKLKL